MQYKSGMNKRLTKLIFIHAINWLPWRCVPHATPNRRWNWGWVIVIAHAQFQSNITFLGEVRKTRENPTPVDSFIHCWIANAFVWTNAVLWLQKGLELALVLAVLRYCIFQLSIHWIMCTLAVYWTNHWRFLVKLKPE